MTVQTMRPKLTEQDIVRLMKGETSEERATVAHRLCRKISSDILSDEERHFAEDIITILADDTAELVRRTMAITLRNSPRLPRDIALKLAQDVESVALPILEHSPAFTDEDLIELVLSATILKQNAIAARATVSGALADVICEHAPQPVVETVVENRGADLSSRAFEAALGRFPKSEQLTGAMVLRENIPVHIAEKLVTLVSGQMFDVLINRHELPAQLAIDLASGARERASIDLVEQAGRTSDLPRFVSQLNLNGRLTHSLIVRALCVGHMSFVEHALAELSGVPHSKVWLMIHDAGPLGMQAIFDRSGLPRKLLVAMRTGVKVYHELELDGAVNDRSRFKLRMIERILTQYQSFPKEDLDYLLEKLDAYANQDRDDETSAA